MSRNTGHLLCKYINFCSTAWWELFSCNTQSYQCAGKQRNCYATRNWELCKNETLWNYITLPAVIRYENTVNTRDCNTAAHERASFNLRNSNAFLRTQWSWKKKPQAERVLWICRLSHREMKAIILKIFMNLLSFTSESLPVLIFSLNLFSRVIYFQPGACWTIHFKYTVWWI